MSSWLRIKAKIKEVRANIFLQALKLVQNEYSFIVKRLKDAIHISVFERGTFLGKIIIRGNELILMADSPHVYRFKQASSRITDAYIASVISAALMQQQFNPFLQQEENGIVINAVRR